MAAIPDAQCPSNVETSYYNRPGAEMFKKRIAEEVLLVQGPVDGVLRCEPGAADVPAVYWNIVEPQEVTRVHSVYAAAGAVLLATNTRDASAPALERDGIALSVDELCRAAVDAARGARPELLAGAAAPNGVSWFKEDSPEFRRSRAAYREQAHALLAAGVDVVLLESFPSIRDLEPALAGVGDVACGMPVLVSFALDEAGDLAGDGLSIEGAILYAEKHGVAAVGADGCSIATATRVLPRMTRAALGPVMIRPAGGEPTLDEEGGLTWDEDPAAFAEACAGWRDAGASLIGCARGTSARTVAAMAERLDAAPSA